MSEEEIKTEAQGEQPVEKAENSEPEEEQAEEESKEENMEEDVKEEKEEEVKDEVEDEEEEPVTPQKEVKPLYDQPLEQTGKRDRKKVDRFVQEAKKEELDVGSGVGTPLGDIPFIDAMIQKMHVDDLKVLHRVAFSRPGSGAEIKKNLRKFNGFSFSKDDAKKWSGCVGRVEKILMSEIKNMLMVLGLERSGNKGEVCERLLEFMLKPVDSGRKPPREKKKGKGRRKSKSSGSAKKENKEGSDGSDGSNSEDEEEEDEEEEEEEEEKPKKTPKKTPAKRAPAKKTPASKKTPARKKKAAVESDDGSSSDDEPLAKKIKQPPTDNELKATVKKLLEDADLEEVTMKSMCRQVFEKYPDFDLTDRKDFIKETVKSIIS